MSKWNPKVENAFDTIMNVTEEWKDLKELDTVMARWRSGGELVAYFGALQEIVALDDDLRKELADCFDGYYDHCRETDIIF